VLVELVVVVLPKMLLETCTIDNNVTCQEGVDEGDDDDD